MQELEPVFDKVARYFSLLSDTSRLKVIHAICSQELSVSDVMVATGLTQSAVSRHLSNLHLSSVASRRKVGAQALYQITDRTLTDICRTACISLVSRESDELVAASALQAQVAQFMPAEASVPEYKSMQAQVSNGAQL